MRVSPAPASLGATVTEVRLASLAEAEWREIERAFHDRGVLVFPGQHLSRAEQTAFGLRFGKLDPLVEKTGTVAISNLRTDGTVREAGDPVLGILRGNEGWHTDSSYMPVAAKASMLSAEIPAQAGGETEWADMRAALDALDAATRTRIDGLAAHHSLVYSQSRIGEEDRGALAYGFEGHDAPLRPLVKRHSATGRASLFIGRHAHGIPGLAPEESEQLLDELLAAACLPPRVWAHRWQAGDIAVWDNRCLLHRARPWDPSQPRVMHHTRIAGDPATESGLAPRVAA